MEKIVVMRDYMKLSKNIFDEFYEGLSLLAKDKGYIADDYRKLLKSNETSENDDYKLDTIFFFEELTDDNFTDLIQINGTTIDRSWLQIKSNVESEATLESLRHTEKDIVIIDKSITLLKEEHQKILLTFFTSIYYYAIYAKSNYKFLGFADDVVGNALNENFVMKFKESIFFMNERSDSYCLVDGVNTDLGLEDMAYSIYKKNGCIDDFIRNDNKILQEIKDKLINGINFISIYDKRNKVSFQNIVHVFNNIYHFCIKSIVSASHSNRENFQYTKYIYFDEKDVLLNIVNEYNKYYSNVTITISHIEEVLKEIIKDRIEKETKDKSIIKLDIESTIIYYKPFHGFLYEDDSEKKVIDTYYLGTSAEEKSYSEYLFIKKHFDKVYPIRVDYLCPYGYDIIGWAYSKKIENSNNQIFTFNENFCKEIVKEADSITGVGSHGIKYIPDKEDTVDFILRFVDISGKEEKLIGEYKHYVGEDVYNKQFRFDV